MVEKSVEAVLYICQTKDIWGVLQLKIFLRRVAAFFDFTMN